MVPLSSKFGCYRSWKVKMVMSVVFLFFLPGVWDRRERTGMPGFCNPAGFCFLSLNAYLFHPDLLCFCLLLGLVNMVPVCGHDSWRTFVLLWCSHAFLQPLEISDWLRHLVSCVFGVCVIDTLGPLFLRTHRYVSNTSPMCIYVCRWKGNPDRAPNNNLTAVPFVLHDSVIKSESSVCGAASRSKRTPFSFRSPRFNSERQSQNGLSVWFCGEMIP